MIAPRAGQFAHYDSPEARCLLLAIAGQESDWSSRLDASTEGRGFWRCHARGLVLNVVTANVTRPTIAAICATLCIPRGLDEVTEACAWNDTLAYWIARLALVLDPVGLPPLGEAMTAWETYTRVWRRTDPNLSTWPERYGSAAALFATPTPSQSPT